MTGTNTADAPAIAQKQPEGLTSEQAALLLKADARNLSKKLREGKSLSGSERTMLQSIATGGEGAAELFAASQVELADVLGISRKTIERARKKEGNPGVRADGRLDISAWREYLRQTTKCFDRDEDHTQTRAKASARNLLLKNEKLEATIAILRRQWMAVDEVERLGADLGSAIRKVVTTLHLTAPSVVGLTVPEAEARLREVENEILNQLRMIDDEVARWKDAIPDESAN